MPSYNIELNNKPNKGSNEYTLLLRVTVNRKHSRLKLDHAIEKKHFNPTPKQNKYIRNTHPKHATINADIDDIIQKAKQAVKDLDQEKKFITAASIKQRMKQVNYSNIIEYAYSVKLTMEENHQVGSSKKYKTLINRLTEYHGSDQLLFGEVTPSFLEKFHRFLISKGNSETTASKYLETLRTIFRKATSAGLTDQIANPFTNYSIKRGPVNKARLSEEEITSIIELDLPETSLIWHVRNAFLFSFYCAGIRASDILQLKWSNIVNGRLAYQMQKTKRIHTLKLHDKPLNILKLYSPGKPEDFIFPFFSNSVDYSDPSFLFNQIGAKTALINKYLKKIATIAKIEKTISTHTARHSFADIARQKTNNLYNLSKTLGHSSIKITEAYLAQFDEKAVDDTIDEVFK